MSWRGIIVLAGIVLTAWGLTGIMLIPGCKPDKKISTSNQVRRRTIDSIEVMADTYTKCANIIDPMTVKSEDRCSTKFTQVQIQLLDSAAAYHKVAMRLIQQGD